MYLNAMNSFLAVQLEALWKVHLKMIVFKWIFLLGYIRKDFNYQTDALSEWREPNFQWKKKIESFHWKKFREIWKRMSVSTWMKRARVSINYINKMDLFIYISVDQTTKWKTEVFFSSFSFYFYRSTLAITCQNAIIRHFNSMNIYHPVLSFTNILQVAVPIASFYFLLQRCARDRRPLRVIYARVCSVGTGLSPSIYYIRVTV